MNCYDLESSSCYSRTWPPILRNDRQEDLDEKERDYQAREEETKDSLQAMVRAFEAKGMTEVQVLVKCSATLQGGAHGTLRKRQRFSKASRKAQVAQVATEEPPEEPPEVSAKPKRKLKPLFTDELVEQEQEPQVEEDSER